MKKLIQIQSELKAPKSQYNKFGKYSYRNCEDILEAIKPILLKHSCFITISDSVQEILGVPYIESTATITDDEGNGVSTTAQAGIEKAGGMALPQAYGSASSYARKYALSGLLLIDDTKDADTTNNHSDEPAKPVEPAMSKDQAASMLGTAKTSDELVLLWKKVPKDLQKENEIVEVAKAIKAAFTLTTEPTKS